jgi:dipeptidyl aminopeptidase/acylaminoacyl peptidase
VSEAVRQAPYGSWSSPISAELLAEAGIRFGMLWLEDGLLRWSEMRPTEGGRSVVVAGDPFGEPADVSPEGFNVRTRVHEYGGGAYAIHRGTMFCSRFEDQRLYRQDAGREPVPITPDTDGRHRYADGRLTADGARWIGVRERHDEGEVTNELVVLPADGSAEPSIVAAGRDFYAGPRISPDGSRLAWLEWDLPWMPWDGSELWVGDLVADGTVSGARRVAGELGRESIVQPAWSPAGELHFVSDRTGWWNLYRERDGAIEPLCPREAEFGEPQWVFGMSRYAFLDDGRIACVRGEDGWAHLGILDPETGELLDVDVPHVVIDGLVAEGDRIAYVGGGPTIPPQVVLLDVTARSVDVLRASGEITVDEASLSVPEALEVPTRDGARTYAWFYPPANPRFAGPPDERPPLIVMSHGGPTSEATPELELETQYWTSRGFAVVDVNYGGSSGHGRAYRERLNGNWGVVDTLDCIDVARALAAAGRVDGDRLLIRGGSAGGYTTLCALTFHDDFRAGASYYGIADLEPFAQPGGTHKFESRYEHTLIGPYPEFADRYRARSPIHSVDLLSAPMILLQGAEDEVVPPAQAEMMVEALAAKGLPYAYLLFEGEQHGFRKAEHIVRAQEAELSFYAQILGFDPGDPIQRVLVENLPAPAG